MLSSLLLASLSIAGTCQGPCEARGQLSVKFTYAITEADAAGSGTIAKTKIYFRDNACAVHGRTARASVGYTIGEANDEGIAPLDVNHRGTILYDIVHVSEDGNTLSFGDDYASDRAARPTVLSTRDRVFVRVPD